MFQKRLDFEGSTTKYPDIVIQNEDSVIENLVDVKTDTGWNRNGMYHFCMEWENRIESVKGKKTSFSDGKSKIKKQGKFSARLKYHVIVASLVNSGKMITEDYQKVLEECSNVSLYILSDGIHPNHYGLPQDQILTQLNIREPEFERLLSWLAKV